MDYHQNNINYKIDYKKLYNVMLDEMGSQGWWPADSKQEILLGAILVQNTNWNNVIQSLEALKIKTNFDPQYILNMEKGEIEGLIKSSGFYKSKSQTIISTFEFFDRHKWNYDSIRHIYGGNLRKELLKIKGIGEETADVILVYIMDHVEFIADNYARKLLYFLTGKKYTNYNQLKKEVVLMDDFTIKEAQEFHGLIDEFGKLFLKNKETFDKSFLSKRKELICYI